MTDISYWDDALEALNTEVASESVNPELITRLVADLEATSLKVKPAERQAITPRVFFTLLIEQHPG